MRRAFPLLALALVGCGAPVPAVDEPVGAGEQAIVGGEVDDSTKAAVGLAINVLDLYFFGHCSGTLVAPNVVLTAQHCVSMTENEGPTGGVVCGKTDFGVTVGGPSMRVTSETERPEEDGPMFYKGMGYVRAAPGTDNLCGFDVALVVLEGEGVPRSVTEPMVPRIDSSPLAGESYAAVGYGLTTPSGGSSGTRMRIEGNTVGCAGDCPKGIEPSEWRGDSPTCPGDSGGPAIDAQGRVMGVLSRGPSGCLSSVYGDVAAWKDFLIQTVLEAAAEADIDPPYWATTGQSEPPPASQPGEACIGVCTEGHVCERSLGDRVCVPRCSPTEACPTGFTCDEDKAACIEDPPPPPAADGGCSWASAPSGSGWPLALLALGGLRVRRRRRPAWA